MVEEILKNTHTFSSEVISTKEIQSKKRIIYF